MVHILMCWSLLQQQTHKAEVKLFLLLHRAFFKFTDYHTPTNALLYIVLV